MTPEAPASGDLKLVLGIRPEQITISREKTDAAQVEARVYAGMPAVPRPWSPSGSVRS